MRTPFEEAFLKGERPPQWVVELARDVALGIGAFPLNQPRPTCHKSQRGAVVYCPSAEETRLLDGGPLNPETKTWVAIGTGRNGPPHPFTCDGGSIQCRERCGKYCIHAEERALRKAIELGYHRLQDLELVHVKVVDREVVLGGPPSCWQCSRTILDVRIGGVWLYEVAHNGWIFRDAEAFHQATLEHCGLVAS